MILDSERTLSVAEFLKEVNLVLKPLQRTVVGEITSLSNRGHVYFTIKDGQDNAVLSCALWQGKYNRLGFELEIGMEVQIFGSANIYPPSGRFTFIVEQIAPVGEGALQKAFEALKKKLELEGCFAPEHKRSLPQFPHKIGLITSADGEAINDFKRHLGPFGFEVLHYDVRVEGIRAIDTIVEAFNWFNQQAHSVEVIVLTRGGGSLESLQAFNSEEVARAVFGSRIPVLTAVGHENDWTIVDYIADYRASTPTDAGRVLSQNWWEAKDKLRYLSHTLLLEVERLMHQPVLLLQQYQQAWLVTFEKALAVQRTFLATSHQHLLHQIQRRLSWFKQVQRNFNYSFIRTESAIKLRHKLLGTYGYNFKTGFSRQSKHADNLLLLMSQKLHLSDPELKLKQGYSMVFNEKGKLIKEISQVQPRDLIQIKVNRGAITSRVEKLEGIS